MLKAPRAQGGRGNGPIAGRAQRGYTAYMKRRRLPALPPRAKALLKAWGPSVLAGLGVLLGGLWLAGGRAPKTLKLPPVPLDALGGGAESLAKCPTGRCLTVVVAPWCGYCRAATPLLLELRALLKKRGFATRFVVTMDEPRNLREYAAVFGKETLLDENSLIRTRGVPAFLVSDADGTVLRSIAGAPQTGDAPAVADYLGF